MPDSAKEQLDKMLKFCERPSSRIRFRFDDGEWEESTGPEFLPRFRTNKSGHVSIDWVGEAVKGENGTN